MENGLICMSICSASVSMSEGDIVVIRGQGTDQGEVKMEADGKLQFANGAEGDHFTRKRDYLNQTVVCTFETGGRYIGANKDSTVSGVTTNDLEVVYWKMIKYWKVTGDIRYFNRMDPENPWYCLQYWGDIQYRTTKLEKGLFMVAEGTGSSARFALRSLKELKDKENGIFSFTAV